MGKTYRRNDRFKKDRRDKNFRKSKKFKEFKQNGKKPFNPLSPPTAESSTALGDDDIV